MTPEQIARAFEPLKVVDVKALDDIAKAMRNSRNKQKRAVGVFLDRINKSRLEAPAKNAKRPAPPHIETGLSDLRE